MTGGDAREIRDHKDVRKVFERNNYEAREGQNGEKVDDEGGRDPSSSLLFLKGCVILPSGITPSNDERPDRHHAFTHSRGTRCDNCNCDER